ncbi:hypothetical protein DFJ73DRAFT_840752 [Zopfochytrium polystomum]|nr:hypothetical protein DFJ73DRAFT_840752 [Zopfochytrium polystomum]
MLFPPAINDIRLTCSHSCVERKKRQYPPWEMGEWWVKEVREGSAQISVQSMWVIGPSRAQRVRSPANRRPSKSTASRPRVPYSSLSDSPALTLSCLSSQVREPSTERGTGGWQKAAGGCEHQPPAVPQTPLDPSSSIRAKTRSEIGKWRRRRKEKKKQRSQEAGVGGGSGLVVRPGRETRRACAGVVRVSVPGTNPLGACGVCRHGARALMEMWGGRKVTRLLLPPPPECEELRARKLT